MASQVFALPNQPRRGLSVTLYTPTAAACCSHRPQAAISTRELEVMLFCPYKVYIAFLYLLSLSDPLTASVQPISLSLQVHFGTYSVFVSDTATGCAYLCRCVYPCLCLSLSPCSCYHCCPSLCSFRPHLTRQCRRRQLSARRRQTTPRG